MKYKIKPYRDGYAIYSKKHWYNFWYHNKIEYWENYADAEKYMNNLKIGNIHDYVG